jgi:UDP-glucose 4-epimerase
MNILITGGAGYIGFSVAMALCQEKLVEKVMVYDNLSRHNESIFFTAFQHAEKIEFVKADILDTRKLKKYAAESDIVIHLAARVTTPFANQEAHFFEQVNHWGTAEAVYASESASIRKFIYLSSTSVFGRSETPALSTTIPQPKSYYGISKLRGEEHVKRLASKLNAITIRCGNVYGYSAALRFDAVINNFMLQAALDKRVTIHGTGMQIRAFTHIQEVVRMLVQVAINEVPSGTYHFVKKNLKINEIADAVEGIYPGLERIYINQHIDMVSQEVRPDSSLEKYIDVEETDLDLQLRAFKKYFTFGFAIR